MMADLYLPYPVPAFTAQSQIRLKFSCNVQQSVLIVIQVAFDALARASLLW